MRRCIPPPPAWPQPHPQANPGWPRPGCTFNARGAVPVTRAEPLPHSSCSEPSNRAAATASCLSCTPPAAWWAAINCGSRSRRRPEGSWAQQQLRFQLAEGSDLEWLPQELVLYADGLFVQQLEVELAEGASFLAAEIVRLGRTADQERLGAGCWRSALSIRRHTAAGPRWELVDRLELADEALTGEHGMAAQPVFGSLVWAAPAPLGTAPLEELLACCRAERAGLEGELACGALEQGLVARYRGPSSQAARYWFTRIWRLTRELRELAAPELPRVWPFQEAPFAPRPTCGGGSP
jgi:urease accessory protein